MKSKQLLLPIALVAAVGGLVQSVRQFRPESVSQPPVTQSLAEAFPIGKPVSIDIEAPPSSELLTPRELRDQVRDWMLLTVLTTSGMTPDKLNEVTFDLPPVRYGFMKGVADWEFGEVRSRAVGDGVVVALIPTNAGGRRAEYLADVADQTRKNIGQRPARVVVIEYAIDPGLATATLTQREPIDGDALFTPAYGYVERSVATLEQFRQFHESVDDLTYAAVRDGVVQLGGRRIPGRAIRGIGSVDVAALWQAETKLTAASDAYEKFVKEKKDALEARWSGRTYRRGDAAAESRLRRELETDQAGVAEQVAAYRKQHGVSDSLGFSLDPAYDYPAMAQFVETYLGRMPVDESKVSDSRDPLTRFGVLVGSRGGLLDAEVAKVAKDLRAGTTGSFFAALQKLKGKAGEDFYEACERRFGLQAARYDGDLQYTEPGMVLFYTDLLAKLWAMDFARSTSAVAIEDFTPLTQVKLSPVFRTELEELRHTRLWFGPQNKGFQIAANKEVFLSRIATRLYAASATSLKQGEESAPNAQTAAFLGWWDDHYDEVARFEPEYERLNEIMKWSLVLGWLHTNGDLRTLSYLETVKVPRNNWFPEWVRRHGELRFRNWDRIGFYNRGAFGLTTEALPRLQSAEYEMFGEGDHYLSGGVSLASRSTFAERPLLSKGVAEGVRRANVRYTGSAAEGFKTLEGVEYNFARTAGRYEVAIKPDAGMRLRGKVGELANQRLRRTLEVRAQGFQYRAAAGDAQIGALDIGKTANGFKVGWASRDVDAGYLLGRRLSSSGDLGVALKADREVAASLRLADGSYVARVKGSDRWVRYVEESTVSSKLDGEWQARVAGYERNARSVKIQWVDEPWMKQRLGAAKFDELTAAFKAKRTPGEALTERMYEREMRGVAEQIAHDPIKVRSQMDAAYRADIAHADELVRSGRSVEAAEHLGRLERAWGATPDISVRRAMVYAERGDLPRAARAIDRAPSGPGRSVDQVYRELELRIKSSAGSRADTWDTLRAAHEWKSAPGGRPLVVVEGDHLQLEYHLSAGSSHAERAAADEAIRSGAPVYVQDSPQLRNLDWSVDVNHTMRQAVDGDLVTILRLSRKDVAHFRPAKIYAPDDTAVMTKVKSPANVRRAGQNAYRAFDATRCDGAVQAGTSRSGCDDDGQAVYLVVPKGSEARYE